jgi:uncharacterized protein YggE
MRTATTLAALAILACFPVRTQQLKADDDRPKISVSGKGLVYAKPSKVTETLAAGVTAGQGVSLETTDFRECREQARELALKAEEETTRRPEATPSARSASKHRST